MRGGKAGYKKKKYVPKRTEEPPVRDGEHSTPAPSAPADDGGTTPATTGAKQTVQPVSGTPPRNTAPTRGRPTVRPQGSGPSGDRPPVRSRQQQIRDTTAPPPGRGAPRTTGTPAHQPAPPRLPTIGVGEGTTPGHTTAIRNTWDMRQLGNLWAGLASEPNPRTALIKVVQRQIIRTQLRELMGGNISTRANISVDGTLDYITRTRDVTKVKTPDQNLTTGSPRAVGVWNASVYDAEVDTVRDIKTWAEGFDPRGKADIVIDLVGTSGPCEACQSRMKNMANEVLDAWAKKYDVARTSLPQLKIVSYYGNAPGKPFSRNGYTTYNGWPGDRSRRDLEFTNKAGWNQFVMEHELTTVNARPPTIRTAAPVPLVGPSPPGTPASVVTTTK